MDEWAAVVSGSWLMLQPLRIGREAPSSPRPPGGLLLKVVEALLDLS